MSNWARPQNEVIDIATNLMGRGYAADGVARSMADQFYMGRSRPRAAAILQKKLEPIEGRLAWQKREARMAELREMVTALEAEGWRWLPEELDDPMGKGCWWYGRISVNRMGDNFESKDAATRYTFTSATRAIILEA